MGTGPLGKMKHSRDGCVDRWLSNNVKVLNATELYTNRIIPTFYPHYKVLKG